jgi:chromosome partitioning protein
MLQETGSVIISVVSQKGGTGKTTVATNLASCYAAMGREVLLVDADPQHSSLDWKADRPQELPPINALHLPEKNLFQEVQNLQQKYALLIIDGGGRITATARAAVAAADFLIIPTLPSKLDMLSTEDFIRTVIQEVQAYKPVVSGGILLNQLQAGTAIGKAAMEHLDTLGYPVFETKLHLYVAYREAAAAGRSVIEYDSTGKAAGEFTAFFKELLEVTHHA